MNFSDFDALINIDWRQSANVSQGGQLKKFYQCW